MSQHSELELYEVTSRLIRLRNILLEATCTYAEISRIMADCYSDDASGKRRFRRDLHNLGALGYTVATLQNPKRWWITTSSHVFTANEVEILAYIREMFTPGHPMSHSVQKLLSAFTRDLPAAQRVLWNRRPALRVPLKPAIDYSHCAALIAFLERAISLRQQISFLYCARGSATPLLYARLDPYEIEYTDRHFYLLAFCYRFGTILMFRIDRIIQDISQESPRMLPDRQQMRRERKPIYFTYQLPASFTTSGVSERFTIHAIRTVGDYVEIDASDTSEFRIIRILLGYGEHASLLAGPQSLLDQMQTIVAKMHDIYVNKNIDSDKN